MPAVGGPRAPAAQPSRQRRSCFGGLEQIAGCVGLGISALAWPWRLRVAQVGPPGLVYVL